MQNRSGGHATGRIREGTLNRGGRNCRWDCIFQVLYVLSFTRPRYQVSVYRTTGPLVSIV